MNSFGYSWGSCVSKYEAGCITGVGYEATAGALTYLGFYDSNDEVGDFWNIPSDPTAIVKEPFTSGDCLTRFVYSTDAAGVAHTTFNGASFWTAAVATKPTVSSATPFELVQVQDATSTQIFTGGTLPPTRGKYVSKILSGCTVGGNSVGLGYEVTDAASGANSPGLTGQSCTDTVWDG